MTKVIRGWEELDGLESDNYYIEVDRHLGCGHIVPKDETSYSPYLSTHTFYGKTHKGYEQLLRTYGFDVELVPWDKE